MRFVFSILKKGGKVIGYKRKQGKITNICFIIFLIKLLNRGSFCLAKHFVEKFFERDLILPDKKQIMFYDSNSDFSNVIIISQYSKRCVKAS